MDIRSPKKTANIFYLDVLRICAIYMVLLLHALNPWLSKPEMYGSKTWLLCLFISPLDRIGVPLFFMISGYLMLSDARTLEIRSFYQRRFPRILIPFLIWCAVYYVEVNHSALSLSGFCSAVLNQTVKYHLWYVYMLLGMYLLAPFLKRMIDNCTRQQVLLLILIIQLPTTLIPFFRLTTRIGIYGFNTMMEGYLGFFLFGYLLAKWPPERKWRNLMYALGLVGWFGGALGNYLYYLAGETSLPFNNGYNLCHYLTAGAVFVLAQALSDRLEQRLPTKPLRYWSGITYGIYLFHVLVLDIWGTYVWFGSAAVNIAASFVVTAVVSTIGMWIAGLIKPIRKLIL